MPTTEKVNVIITGKDKSKGAFQSAGKGASGLSSKLGTLAKVAIPALVIGMGVKAIKAATEFSSAMSNINTLMDDNGEAVAELEVGIKEMLKTVPKSAKELGASAYAIVSAGISDTSQALIVLEESAKLAVAGLGTTEEATDLMTSAINAFSIEAKDADKVANSFFLSVKSGKTTVAELAEGFGQVAPLANELGIELDDLLSVTSAMTTSGLKASVAYSQIKGALSNMLKPTKDMEEVMGELGLTTDGLKESLAEEGLVGTVRMLSEAVDDDTGKLAKMFGSVEGLNAVMMLLNTTGDNAIGIFDGMQTELDSLAIAYEKQKEQTEALWQITKNKFEVVFINLGNVVLPAVNKALGILGDFLNSIIGFFETMASPMETIRGFLDKLTGSVDESNTVIQFFRDMWQEIVDVFVLMVKPAMDELRQTYIDNKEMIDQWVIVLKELGKIFLVVVVVAITAVILAVMQLLTWFIKITNFFTERYFKALDQLTGFLNGIRDAYNSIKEAIKGAWEMAKRASFGSVVGGLKSRLGFQSGGIVNAPLGAPVLATVHGGEQIIPSSRAKGAMGGNITINLNGNFLSEDVALEIGDVIIDRLKLQMRV